MSSHVATLALLSGTATRRGVDDTAMETGDQAYVDNIGGGFGASYYHLDKLSTAVLSSPDVLYTYTAQLSSPVGPGRWLRGPCRDGCPEPG